MFARAVVIASESAKAWSNYAAVVTSEQQWLLEEKRFSSERRTFTVPPSEVQDGDLIPEEQLPPQHQTPPCNNNNNNNNNTGPILNQPVLFGRPAFLINKKVCPVEGLEPQQPIDTAVVLASSKNMEALATVSNPNP